MAQSIVNSDNEQLGMLALVTLALIPGALWISRGKSTASMVLRTAVVAGTIVGLVAVEAIIDKEAEAVAEAL